MIIIPARLESKRFPQKVLVEINGLPMVVRTAQVAQKVDDVVVATDSHDVMKILNNYNIKGVITSGHHKSGTDRIREAVDILNISNDEVIINLQADEPYIEKDVVKQVYDLAYSHRSSVRVLMNSAYKVVENSRRNDPNIVKVVVNRTHRALYFSRAPIPFARDDKIGSFNAHIGIYGFTVRSLKIFCMLGYSQLEELEKLEQLRALEFGYDIALVEVKSESFGIDTPNDLKRLSKKNR